MPALLLSLLTHLFLSSSLSLSYFILAVPMRKCLGKHSCMNFSFPIVILNDTSFLLTGQLQVHNGNPARYGRNTNALVNLNTKLNLGWMDSVKVALGNRGMMVEAARQCVKDRKEWRALVHM